MPRLWLQMRSGVRDCNLPKCHAPPVDRGAPERSDRRHCFDRNDVWLSGSST